MICDINGLDLILSIDLKKNIILLKKEVVSFIIKNNHGINCNVVDLIKKINEILYNYILGIERPITICDGRCGIVNNNIMIKIYVDYKVTSGYVPYQDLEEPIKLVFTINKSIIRDEKINEILSDD